MGKLIYQPKGKAREYAPWACNLFNGCSNRCSYCYNRHGRGKALLGKDEPTPKGGITREQMLYLFRYELRKYKDEILRDGKGLFFSFVSDPLKGYAALHTIECAEYAISCDVPVIFLTKSFDVTVDVDILQFCWSNKEMIKVGFTLTGYDKLEPNAIWNSMRISSIKRLNELGIKTWASIEPVISINQSFSMIQYAYMAGCREFKIGLLSGKKKYTPDEVEAFMKIVDMTYGGDCDIYWKESVIDYIHKTK